MIALGIALGATGYAAIGLSASSAENKQVKNAAATTKRIAGDAVTSAKVKRNSKYVCTLPVTVMERDRTKTTKSAGEAGL